MARQLPRMMAVSALGILPYLAINVVRIASATGSIVHMSPLEWAIITFVLALIFWVGGVAFLWIAAAATRRSPLLFGPALLLAYAAVATILEPEFWADMYRDPLEDAGIGEWLFGTGLVTISLALIPRRRGFLGARL